jgi:hypothetical protein
MREITGRYLLHQLPAGSDTVQAEIRWHIKPRAWRCCLLPVKQPQFATDAAPGYIQINYQGFMANYPDPDAGPSEHSASPSMDAAQTAILMRLQYLLRICPKLLINMLCAVCQVAVNQKKRNEFHPIVDGLARSLNTAIAPKPSKRTRS